VVRKLHVLILINLRKSQIYNLEQNEKERDTLQEFIYEHVQLSLPTQVHLRRTILENYTVLLKYICLGPGLVR
jgi:hypothetical protein